LDAEFMVGLLRRMKHDLANHLQVLNGYLQLGQPDEAQDYLHSVIEGLDAERMILRSLPAPACLYFYDQLLKANDLGIGLRFEDIDLESWELLKDRREPAASLEIIRQELGIGCQEPVVFLSICEEAGGIDLLYSGWSGGVGSRAFRIEKE